MGVPYEFENESYDSIDEILPDCGLLVLIDNIYLILGLVSRYVRKRAFFEENMRCLLETWQTGMRTSIDAEASKPHYSQICDRQ